MLPALTALVLMSDLYDVKVLSRGPQQVVLEVEAVHPDVGPGTADLGFALSLLGDESDRGDAPSALAREMDLEDVLDDAWLEATARGFVKKVTAKPIDPAVGFMTVPTDLVDVGDFRVDPASVPTLVDVPAFGVSSYQATPVYGPDGLVGRAVMHVSRGAQKLGTVLLAADGEVLLLHVANGSFGMTRLPLSGLHLLSYAPHAVERERLSFERVLSFVPVTLAQVRVSGAAAQISLRVPPDGRAAPTFGKADALELMVRPVMDVFGKVLIDCPLSRAITVELKNRGAKSPSHIYEAIAPTYVKSATLVFGAPRSRPPAQVSPAEERAYLEAPWPEGKIELQATDAKWLSHFAASHPRQLR